MSELKQQALFTLGSVIRKKRLEMGITQEALGEKVGYGKLTSKQVISQIERGATAIPNKKMNDFIVALNLEKETFQQVNFLMATQEYQKAMDLMKPFLEGSILMGNSLSSPKNEPSDVPPSDNNNVEEKSLTEEGEKEDENGNTATSNIESSVQNVEVGRVTDTVMETEDDDEEEKLGKGRNETPKQKHNANVGKNQGEKKGEKQADKIDTLAQKLVNLQKLLDLGAITSQDYEDTKKRWLDEYL